VANVIGKPGTEAGPAASAFCSNRAVTIDDRSKLAWNGWGPGRDNTRFVPAAVAKLTPASVKRLAVTWAFGFDGDISAFAQPTVIGNQIFVGSASGMVHALKADTGCLQWVFQAVGPVRSSIVAAKDGNRHVLLFGDLTGWFYALDAATGKEIWRTRPEAHESARLSGAPLVHDGIAYIPAASWEESRALNADYPCCSYRGSLTALRVRDGRQAWKSYLVDEPTLTGTTPSGTPTWGPSGVGTWGAPTLDLTRRAIYITTGDNYSFPASPHSDAVVAIDMATGAIRWSTQTLKGDVYNSACGLATKGPNCLPNSGPDHDFGSAAILTKTPGGRALLLAGQKSGIVYALDPDKQGAIVWQARVAKGGIVGGIQWGMASDAQHVYAPTSDATFTTTALARVLDPKAGGGLTALRIADGSTVWHVGPTPCGPIPGCSPALSAAATVIPGVLFAGGLDGHLRAYATADGAVIWDMDTVRPYNTVNGVTGKGGSIDGPGPVVVNGMVFVNSGYTRYGGIPGNVLLAFAPAAP
jgi:polyvinyl alcohol dehydrogenase (cytochrome)